MKETRECEERIRGSDHSNVALNRIGLGERLIADDELEAAIEVRKDALARAVRERSDAIAHKHFLLGCALHYHACGSNLKDAVHHLQAAVALAPVVGKTDSEQITMRYRLGFALMTFGDDCEAVQVLLPAYQDARRLHGKDHFQTVKIRCTLAYALGFLGSFAAAIDHLRACLQYPKAGLHSALGVQFFYLDQFDEALNCFEAAVALNEKSYAIEKALYRSNLARCLLALGRTGPAAAHLEVATAITSKLPLNHIDRLRDRHIAALLLGQDPKSVAELQSLVADASTTLHSKHRLLAMYYHDLSDACLRQNELVLAEAYSRQALQISVGPTNNLAQYAESWQAARDRIKLAEILEKRGRFEEVVDLLQRAVAPCVATFGRDHGKVVKLQRKLSAVLLQRS